MFAKCFHVIFVNESPQRGCVTLTINSLIRMDDEVIKTVTEKWPKLGLPGSGKPIWE